MDLLKRLIDTPGVPGYEDDIRALVKKELESLTDEVRIDNMGNLIGVKKGSGDGPKVMLAAHMDQIGFLVS
ncbi:MAG: M42 family peptidase, partial [bacterium]